MTEKKKIRYEAEREIVVLRVPEPIFEKDELQEAEERRARRAFRNTNCCLFVLSDSNLSHIKMDA